MSEITPARAIEILKNLNFRAQGETKQANNLAIEALEKRIPKKVTHEASLLRCCTCPSCLNVVDEFEKLGDSTARIKYDYCRFCGQKLDWSDSE